MEQFHFIAGVSRSGKKPMRVGRWGPWPNYPWNVLLEHGVEWRLLLPVILEMAVSQLYFSQHNSQIYLTNHPMGYRHRVDRVNRFMLYKLMTRMNLKFDGR